LGNPAATLLPEGRPRLGPRFAANGRWGKIVNDSTARGIQSVEPRDRAAL